MPKRTHQPKTKSRARKIGFRARMRKMKKGLSKVLKSRRKKGRKKLT